MASQVLPASRRDGALLLADISGYTGFLQGDADAHRDIIVEADEPPPAYAVLSHLLDTMVGAVEPTFRLAKFEGDAIFAVTADSSVSGVELLDVLQRCYAAFRGAIDHEGCADRYAALSPALPRLRDGHGHIGQVVRRSCLVTQGSKSSLRLGERRRTPRRRTMTSTHDDPSRILRRVSPRGRHRSKRAHSRSRGF